MKQSYLVVAALVAFLLVLPTGCAGPTKGTPLATEIALATETPVPPAVAQGRCGDGQCDDAEKTNPNLCPQDCADTTRPQATETGDEALAQPNIVFILTDDLDLAALDHMPKLQALIAEQGLTLSNFLISMPLCCPSRATILRGQYAHCTQIMGNDLPFGGFPKFLELGEEDSTVATWLQAAGYRTMLAGKYLNAFPLQDDLMHIPPGWTEWFSPMAGVPYAQYDYTLNENGQQVVYGDAPEDYGTDVYARKTVEFIERAAREGQPFFAHVSVYAPHWPTTPAPRHADLFADVSAPRTPNFNEEDVSDKPSYIRNLPLLAEADIARLDEDWRNRLRAMQSVDDLIESVVGTLEATGQLDNTYLFFTSDNGYHYGNHRQLLGKTAPYEEEIRVSMMVRGPGVPAGQALDHLAGNIDLAPTWAELGGVEPPDFVDGRSLVPLLAGSPPPVNEWRQSFLLEHAPYEPPGQARAVTAQATNTPVGLLEPPDPEDEFSSGTLAALASGSEALPYRGIRTAGYVYVEYPTDERELYDLRTDPYQLQNLVATAPPELLSELAQRLRELATCAGATCRSIEDKPFTTAQAGAPGPQETGTAPARRPSEPLIYYLGYATPENMEWIEAFDAEVLTRGFLLFLNPGDAWLDDYRPRMQQCQQDGRQFLVALQAAVLVENGNELPALGPGDPTLAFPMAPIPQWQDYACRTSEGLTLKEKGYEFSHACLNNAEFREFLQDRLRAIVDSGADGVHIDELPTRYFARQEGYCDACLAGFRQYLADKYTAAELHSLYDVTDVGAFDFRARLAEEGNLQTPPASPLHREWWLYQLGALAAAESEIFASTRSYAQGQGRAFIMTSNAYEPERNPAHVVEMTLADYVSIGTGLTIELRQEGGAGSTLRFPPDYSYLPVYRLAQAIAPGKPVALFIDGPGGTGVIKDLAERTQGDVVRWMFAEAYAAGGRFHVPYPSLDYYAPLDRCDQYVRFIRDNRGVYEGVDHLADVGVLFSYASQIWDFWGWGTPAEPNHSLQWYGLAQALTDMSIQYGVVFAPDGSAIPDGLEVDDLLAYETIIVPWAYALRDQHIQLLEEVARSGRRLIIVGAFASLDEQQNQRQVDPLASLRSLGAIVVPGLNFESYLNDPSGPGAAAALDALNDLFPDRQVTVSHGWVSAQLNRKGDALYCHLINRDLGDAGFVTQEDVEVTILPPGDLDLSPEARAVYQSPEWQDGQPVLLALNRSDGALQVTIPAVEVYGVLTISDTD